MYIYIEKIIITLSELIIELNIFFRISTNLAEDPIYHLPRHLISKATKYARGDENFSEESETPRKATYKKGNLMRTSSTSSFFGTDSDDSRDFQSTQASKRVIKKSKRATHWLVRKTRSGHIYGKYPV